MEKTFHEKYAPPTQSRRNSTSGQQGHRASGQCDFSIDNGQRPIDVSREVDLPTVPVLKFLLRGARSKMFQVGVGWFLETLYCSCCGKRSLSDLNHSFWNHN